MQAKERGRLEDNRVMNLEFAMDSRPACAASGPLIVTAEVSGFITATIVRPRKRTT